MLGFPAHPHPKGGSRYPTAIRPYVHVHERHFTFPYFYIHAPRATPHATCPPRRKAQPPRCRCCAQPTRPARITPAHPPSTETLLLPRPRGHGPLLRPTAPPAQRSRPEPPITHAPTYALSVTPTAPPPCSRRRRPIIEANHRGESPGPNTDHRPSLARPRVAPVSSLTRPWLVTGPPLAGHLPAPGWSLAGP